jgi:plasmid stability protein
MPVNLSIKNVPDELAEGLRVRARHNHRSLQGELLVILEEAVAPNDRLTAMQVLTRVRRLGLRTPAEAARLVRADRNAR